MTAQHSLRLAVRGLIPVYMLYGLIPIIVLIVQCSAATYGSCIKVNGTLVPSEHDRQPVEVRAESIEVTGSCYFKVSFHLLLCHHFYLHI